jgi:hypothetical protein
MRDDDASRHTSDPLPLAVLVQPDPMLEERPVGPLRLIAVSLAAAVIVAVALYGMTRPAGEPEVAAAPESQTAPAGGGAASNAGGQTQPANAPAQNAQRPTTTGQGTGEQAAQPGQPKTPPAAGGSATSTVGPGAKPAPQAK